MQYRSQESCTKVARGEGRGRGGGIAADKVAAAAPKVQAAEGEAAVLADSAARAEAAAAASREKKKKTTVFHSLSPCAQLLHEILDENRDGGVAAHKPYNLQAPAPGD